MLRLFPSDVVDYDSPRKAVEELVNKLLTGKKVLRVNFATYASEDAIDSIAFEGGVVLKLFGDDLNGATILSIEVEE